MGGANEAIQLRVLGFWHAKCRSAPYEASRASNRRAHRHQVAENKEYNSAHGLKIRIGSCHPVWGCMFRCVNPTHSLQVFDSEPQSLNSFHTKIGMDCKRSLGIAARNLGGVVFC